jgi:hypothetical protein
LIVAMLTWSASSLTLAFAVSAGPMSSLLGNPEAAAHFDYCAWSVEESGVLDVAEAALVEDAHGVSEREQAAALLIKAGLQVAASNPGSEACRRVFKTGDQRFERALSRRQRQVRRNDDYDPADDARVAEAQSRITAQWVADQSGRMAYLDLATPDRSGTEFWAQRRATAHVVSIDAGSTELMRELLREFDWIDRERFGNRVSAHAWLLVQHADDHPDLQKLALERMAAHLDNGGVRARDYAFLWDRVAVNTGRLQRYGTQPGDACTSDGRLELKPVEDPDALDARREAIGLGPAAADLAQMVKQRCGVAR